MPTFIINDTVIFFLKLPSAMWYFQTIAVSERCLIRLLSCILFAEIYSYFENLYFTRMNISSSKINGK